MPPQNATDLINWFPQPGYVELRRGFANWCDTGTGAPVETLMAFMGSTGSKLFAASATSIYDVTGTTPTTLATGFTSDRWQFTDFAGTGGSFLWMCNGFDTPRYYDGSALQTASITVSSGEPSSDIINCVVYQDRIWGVLKNSTKAGYLAVDSVQGAFTVFDVGNQFINGGYLQAIGTFSTDTIDGPNEFICFISSQGDVAVYLITDPTTSDGISFRGRSEISQPVGDRCLCKIGADLGVICLDGVLPISHILTYDKAALIGASITKNIKAAITQAVRSGKDLFGWSLTSYPRNTMAILNVPIMENGTQEQYVMNTLTGAWCRFTGQNANCWEVFLDKPYFGGNDGVVRLADETGGDEDQTLMADMRSAFNYYGARGQLKQWTTLRPNMTINVAFPVDPEIGLNIDFSTDALLNPITFGTGVTQALWDIALWDIATWPGDITSIDWVGANGVGYCASIRMTVTIPWSENVREARTLQINGFDVLQQEGAFI